MVIYCLFICLQVHAGPMAYAEVFLSDEKQIRYRRDRVTELKHTFRYVTSVSPLCSLAVGIDASNAQYFPVIYEKYVVNKDDTLDLWKNYTQLKTTFVIVGS